VWGPQVERSRLDGAPTCDRETGRHGAAQTCHGSAVGWLGRGTGRGPEVLRSVPGPCGNNNLVTVHLISCDSSTSSMWRRVIALCLELSVVIEMTIDQLSVCCG